MLYMMRKAIAIFRHVSLPIQSILVKLNSRSCHQYLPPTGSVVTKKLDLVGWDDT